MAGQASAPIRIHLDECAGRLALEIETVSAPAECASASGAALGVEVILIALELS
jgi:hypothetical protein